DLRLVRPAIARVRPLPQRRLRRAPDERARRVDEEEVELLAEEVPVLEEQRPLEGLPRQLQEASYRAVEMLQRDPLEAGTLNGPSHWTPCKSLRGAQRRWRASAKVTRSTTSKSNRR